MSVAQLKSRTRSLLRYPGSKARLARFIAEAMLINDLQRSIFIEPFCGGASVSIALLEANIVEEVVLNDRDPIVASLWKCVFSKSDSKWLADMIMRVPLTLEYWRIQKRLKPQNKREAALKCLYLNRTSFSGVLQDRAGPIGGSMQAKWTIGCRFNRERLSSRILELSCLSHRVRTITQRSWIDVCKRWRSKGDIFIYLDPPFFHKANRLYRYVFSENCHYALRNYIMNLKSPWILSYDNAQEVRDLYSHLELQSRLIDNTYSAHPIGGNSFIGREIVYSNLKKLPLPSGNTSTHVGLSVKSCYHKGKIEYNESRMPMFSY